MSCDCEGSPFKNSHFGHVITGDLELIQDSSLRRLCSYGTKFRENPVLNIGKIKSQFSENVDAFIVKVSRKLNIPRSAFHKWKRGLLANFNSKLYVCSGRFSYTRPVLSSACSKLELDRLQSKYVITVVDKAANNFAFTCKKLYFLKLAEELGMNNVNLGNETYMLIQLSQKLLNKLS